MIEIKKDKLINIYNTQSAPRLTRGPSVKN